MHIHLVTLFPEFFRSPLETGLMQRACEAGLLSFSFHNPRDHATDSHLSVDDRPYGGGPGMVMLPGPLAKSLNNIGFSGPERLLGHRLLYLSPKGKPLTQKVARELAQSPNLTLICGRYEGIDARIEELFPVEAISVGDFVINGGESAALCLMEAVGRLLPGFMGHEASGDEESFSHGLLEYPHYTRPEVFEGCEVPAVLRSGDHAKIALWRRKASLEATLLHRSDLLGEASLSDGDADFLREITIPRYGKNLYCGLVHYPVLDKQKNSIAVSLTNLDIHDIARSSYSYGLGGYYIITPLADQRRLLNEILSHWKEGAGQGSNPHRGEALCLASGVESIAEAIASIEKQTGQRPVVIGTGARFAPDGVASAGFAHIADLLRRQPVLLLFGTSHGLAPEVHALCDAFAPPVRWHGGYNHLSVRSAVAIIIDRILGDWG